MYFDINGLRSANAQYGMNYGDDVLRGVAGAIRGLVRKGDLVARWGGDEFLVAGVGSRPDADELACRIQTEIAETGLNLGRWPTTVGVGTAAGDPSEVTFEHLVEIAQRAAYDKEHQPHPSA
jgi:diguanylate cyclase (GGDEF)-like protein